MSEKLVDTRGFSKKQLEDLDLDVLRKLCFDRCLPIKKRAHRKTCVAQLLEHVAKTSASVTVTPPAADTSSHDEQPLPSTDDRAVAAPVVTLDAEALSKQPISASQNEAACRSDKEVLCLPWPHEDKKHSYPPSHTGGSYGFTRKTLVTLRKVLPDGGIEWCDPFTAVKRIYSNDEWKELEAKWTELYPPLYPTEMPHPHETEGHRIAACAKERHRCWDSLDKTNSSIPSKFVDEYVRPQSSFLPVLTIRFV